MRAVTRAGPLPVLRSADRLRLSPVAEGLAGLPRRRHRKNLANVATFEDLVQRKFTRDRANQLWVTDITEHPTREGKIYCCVVLDAHSRGRGHIT